MTRFALGLCGLLVLCAGSAWAAEPEGVWTGTIDQAPVVVCFDDAKSTYYYVRFGVDIPLVPGESGVWEEKKGDQPSTGTWRFSAPGEKELTGTWTAPDGRRKLAVKLKRARLPKPTPKDEAGLACSPSAYNGPRMGSVTRTPGKEETRGGLTFRPFKAKKDALVGVEIVSDAEELAPLKRALEKMNRDMILSFFDCLQLVADQDPSMGGQYNGTIEIEAVTEHFVVVRSNSEYDCGGAHPDNDETHFVLDRQSGKPIKLKTWFTTSPTSLGAKFWKADQDECKDESPSSFGFDVWPSAKGMVFVPQMPHVAQACETETTVPYAKLEPKLTAAGKRAVAEFAEMKPDGK